MNNKKHKKIKNFERTFKKNVVNNCEVVKKNLEDSIKELEARQKDLADSIDELNNLPEPSHPFYRMAKIGFGKLFTRLDRNIGKIFLNGKYPTGLGKDGLKSWLKATNMLPIFVNLIDKTCSKLRNGNPDCVGPKHNSLLNYYLTELSILWLGVGIEFLQNQIAIFNDYIEKNCSSCTSPIALNLNQK